MLYSHSIRFFGNRNESYSPCSGSERAVKDNANGRTRVIVRTILAIHLSANDPSLCFAEVFILSATFEAGLPPAGGFFLCGSASIRSNATLGVVRVGAVRETSIVS